MSQHDVSATAPALWTAPVLEELSVDLTSIATGTPNTTDSAPGAHTS